MAKKKKSRSSKYDKEKAAARNRAQTQEKEQILELLDQHCRSLKEPPPDKKDRLPLLEMLFCLILKVYFQVSYRNLCSFLVEMRAQGYITFVPFYNSFGNYMNSAEVTPLLDRLIGKTVLASTSEGIHASIDSTRLFTPGYHKEKIKKGPNKGRYVRRRNNVRLHVIVDNKTHLILAAAVSKYYEDEKQFFEPLLRQATQRGKILTIAGDKNYSSEANVKLAKELGCTPYLTPKKNYKSDPAKKSSSWNENLNRYREGTAEDSERFVQRKQIETTFSMSKVRFSDELESKNFQAQINEALCLVICQNLRVLIFLRQLYGTEVTFPPD